MNLSLKFLTFAEEVRDDESRERMKEGNEYFGVILNFRVYIIDQYKKSVEYDKLKTKGWVFHFTSPWNAP